VYSGKVQMANCWFINGNKSEGLRSTLPADKKQDNNKNKASN